MYDAESLYAWAQERQLRFEREAERRRVVREARRGGHGTRIRIPFLARHHA